jgi:hypothetical protein
MTQAIALPRGQTRTVAIAAVGMALGLAYTLSPLTVLMLGVVAAASYAASRGLSQTERRWFWCVMSTAVLLRLLAIALLFLTADPARPFASFFGDEELYKFRTVWVRNIGQGIPISPADVIYSFDAVGNTGYMDVLAFVQVLVGDAPYGLHLLNMTLCLCGVLALYRLARGAYGTTVSMAGLVTLLFLPSVFFWSISILKEPMNVFMLAGELICAVFIVRAPRPGWGGWQKGLAAAGVVVFALAMESLRAGGVLTAAIGTIGGIALTWTLARGRRWMTALVLVPATVVMLVTLPSVQDRMLANVRRVAFYHAGHVLTPGFSYRLVDIQYYSQRIQLLNNMPPSDAGRFVISALWNYFVQPLPWKTESRALQAYLPEQFIWYVMALLIPFGVLAGLRRDRLITSMLLCHAAAAMVLVAVTSGNLGTLIRHRSLALPYLVWLSALGAQDCVRRYLRRYQPGLPAEASAKAELEKESY